MKYTIWIKETARNWRKLPGMYGCWESIDGAITHAHGIAPSYIEVTVEDHVGAVIWRSGNPIDQYYRDRAASGLASQTARKP
jgi:hypothetical protein